LFLASVVHPSFITSKADARAMYKHLTGDTLPRDRSKGKDSAILLAEMALATQDFDLISDLRDMNGRPKDKSFDIFWIEIMSILEAHARVDDRRHGNTMMPMLIFHLYIFTVNLRCFTCCLYLR